MASKPTVIGVDVGAANTVVAYIAKGVDIVLDQSSKRQTPSCVVFGNENRLLGTEGDSVIKSNLKNSATNFRSLIGLKFGTETQKAEKPFALGQLVETDKGNVGFKVNFCKDADKQEYDDKVIDAATIYSMYLDNVIQISREHCNAPCTGMVLAVPSYFSHHERTMVVNAAKIANCWSGMDCPCLRLLDDSAAVALNYGIYRSADLPAKEAKPLYVAFCNMGATSFECSIVKFFSGKLEMESVECSVDCGGRDMDMVLMKQVDEVFKKKLQDHDSIFDNKKAQVKLQAGVEKAKKILSANMEAGVNVDSCLEDLDVSQKLTRADLEAAMAGKMQLLKETCQRALAAVTVTEPAAAGSQEIVKRPLKAEEVDSVELIGGGVYAPCVQNAISEVFIDGQEGKQLSHTLNKDESIARGCALQAAMLSPLWQVRNFEIAAKTQVAISIGYPDGPDVAEPAKKSVMFPVGALFKTTKSFKIQRKGPFKLSVFYGDGAWAPFGEFQNETDYGSAARLREGVPREIAEYTIDFPKSEEGREVAVFCELDINGCFQISKVKMSYTKEYEETVKEIQEVPIEEGEEEEKKEETEEKKEGEEAASAAEGDASMAEAEAPVASEATPEASEKKDSDADADMADAEKKEGEDKKAEEKPKTKKIEVEVLKKKTKTITEQVPFSVSLPEDCKRFHLSSDEFKALQDDEKFFRNQSRDVKDRQLSHNKLEELIYETKRVLEEGKLNEYVKDTDKEAILATCNSVLDKVYNYEITKKADLDDKIIDIEGFIKPIQKREEEHRLREELFAKLLSICSESRGQAQNESEDYAHIAAEKKEEIVKLANEMEGWAAGKKAEISAMELSDDAIVAVVTAAQIKAQATELHNKTVDIMSEPKPAPKEEEKKEGEKKEGEGEQMETETAQGESTGDKTNGTDGDNVRDTPMEEKGEALPQEGDAAVPESMDID